MEPHFPFPSLAFLVPPLRMMSAFMWRVVHQGNTKHYGKLEEFVSMVTEEVPELLNNKQKCLLILALRGRMTLQLLRSGRPDDLKAVQTHLDGLRSHGVKQSNDAVIESAETNFLKLVESLLEDPEEREHFFRVVFPVEYGPNFEMALQALVCHFLSRLEELLPVPDFKQTASLISAAPSVLEDYMRCVSHDDLNSMLHNQQYHGNLKLPQSAPTQTEDRLLHSLSFPPSLRLANVLHHSTGYSESESFTVYERPPLPIRDDLETVTDSLCGEMLKGNVDKNKNETNSVEYQKGPQSTNEHKEVKDEAVHVQNIQFKSEEEGRTVSIYHEHQYSRSTNACPQTVLQLQVPSTSPQAALNSTSFQDATSSSSTMTQGTTTSTNPTTSISPSTTPTMSSPSCTPGSSDQPPRRVAHKCPQCGRCFIYRYKMLEHQRLHTGENPYKCSQCGKTFRRSSDISNHRRTQCSNAAYVCIKCGSSFGSVQDRVNHRCGGSHSCHNCGKVFRCQSHLTVHMRSHNGERPYHCTYCDKRFTLRGNLTIHIRTHTGEKPFVCSYCGKAFCSPGDLQSHRRTHTGEKPYNCTICQKGFTMSGQLTLHMRLHTGERPYLCHECGDTFRRGVDLKTHVLNHSGLRPFSCHLCSKTYKCKNHLNCHLKTHSSTSLDIIKQSSVATV
ncbi:zinc finger protein 624-like isoform X2 [Esox lucius]|uniref:zinc finger protein 624-like isoform X2 n=1 Tax=Esox lucius TaxID=8010 RepID=UPI00147746D1|nr:zinc finger protein 624-like isoform X2 [Esox lucius]